MDAALEQLKELASMAGYEARQPLILELTKIIHSLETPDDMIMRIGGLLLADADSPVTVRQLSQKTGAEKTLLGRLFHYLAAIAMVDEVSKDTFVANHASRNMTAKTVNPEYYTLPTHLKKTGYKNPNDETYTSWHDAFNTDQGPFSWFAEHPDNMTYFNDYMSLRRGPELGWLSVYPVREEAAGWCQERPLYVNIGGNVGQQCAEFREKYPDIPGRVILQDLPHSITPALPTPGVENTVHKFFEAQPMKGAKFYFLRGIFHDHPDSKVRLILEHTKASMTSESILLIDEIIPPEVGVRLDAAAHDITMLVANAGAERSEAQWRALFAGFGLRLVKTYLYNAPSCEGVMDVRLV